MRFVTHGRRNCFQEPGRHRRVLYNRIVPSDFAAHQAESAPHKPLHLKTFLMILVMIIAGPFGNVLLGKGMKHLGRVTLWPVPALFHTGIVVFSTPMIWFGIACLITFFISYMLALSWADYSFVQPTASLAYGVVALLSLFILGEHVSLLRWAGIAVICIGVFVVSHTAPNTTRGNVQEEN